MITITKQDFENNYIIKDYTISHLKELGFRKYHLMTGEDCNWSIYKFPVCKYLGTTTLECEIKVNTDNGDIRVDIYDMDREIFPMFYNEITAWNKNFLATINKKIVNEFKKLGVIKK